MTGKELEQIYNEAYKAVYWTAMALLKNEADAEDVVQDTFVSFIESYSELEDTGKAKALLKKIAANKSLNRIRLTKTDAVEDEFFDNVEAVPEDFLPDTIVESKEMRKIVMDIIDNTLSEDVRRTLILFYFDEMSTKEIAEVLGIPQGTVLWRLNFAKKKIKKEVEKYEEENKTKLFGMVIPFLSKLFMKESEQVVFKPMSASLANLSASVKASGRDVSIKTSAEVVKKGTDIMKMKVLIAVAIGVASVLVTIGVVLGVAGKKGAIAPKKPRETTVAAEKKASSTGKLPPNQEVMGYFIIEHIDGETNICGITDEGKEQETLVIPAGINHIYTSVRDCQVKHISFESDDDIEFSAAFSVSKTLETVELPKNLKKLPAISNCPALKEITIPKGVTEIPVSCFANDTSLETVRIEGNVTKIDNQAFKGCKSLKNINLPDSVTYIGNWAFHECSSLREITLPAGLKVIGELAFSDIGLETVIVPKELELEKWDGAAFIQLKNTYTVKVRSGSWADSNFDEVFQGQVEKAYN